VHELVDRLQLDRGDPEPLQVVDGHGVGEPGIGAPQHRRDVGMGGGEPLDVHLVDHRVVQRVVRRPVGGPVEERADHHALGDMRRTVLVVAGAVVVEGIGEAGGMPVDPAVERLGVGVEQQLGGVAAPALGRVPGAMHPEPVALADAEPGQVGVPAEPVDLGQRDAALAAVVEQAQLDDLGHLGEQGEVGAGAVVGGAQRIGPARPHLDLGHRTTLGGDAGGPIRAARTEAAPHACRCRVLSAETVAPATSSRDKTRSVGHPALDAGLEHVHRGGEGPSWPGGRWGGGGGRPGPRSPGRRPGPSCCGGTGRARRPGSASSPAPGSGGVRAAAGGEASARRTPRRRSSGGTCGRTPRSVRPAHPAPPARRRPRNPREPGYPIRWRL
jgi:hypothetical protein